MPRALVVPDAGVRFGLSDLTFERWWNSALMPEDADEFVHLHGGNKLGARFVCALDYLTATGQQRPPADIIVQAYVLARKFDDDMRLDDKTRIDAQFLYVDGAVEALLERLRYRERNAAMERVAKLTLKTVEDHLISGPSDDDIKAGVTLISIDQRARAQDVQRRDRRAYLQAMETSRSEVRDASQPPSLDEFRHSIVMAIELFGIETVREVVFSALPIDGSADKTTVTIEAEA